MNGSLRNVFVSLSGLALLASLAAQNEAVQNEGAQNAPRQKETMELAQALVRSWAPATDDPDAVVRDLVAVALAHRRSPIAWLLLEEATKHHDEVLDPAALTAALPEGAGDRSMNGLVAQKCSELRWYLRGAVDGDASAGPPPAFGYCRQARAIGPMGDGGDHFVGVVMTPELQFPPLGSTLPGRGRPAHVFVIDSAWSSAYLDPGRMVAEQGCFYTLLRCKVDEATETFFEWTCESDGQVFVDGREVLRLERWHNTALRRSYAGLRLPAGVHEVLVKSCTNGNAHFAARFVDADGWPNAHVAWLAADDTSAIAAERAESTPATFGAAADLLASAAERDGDATIAIAALVAAVRDGHQDRAIDLAVRLQKAKPADAVSKLALAQLLRFVDLPDEVGKAEGRALAEAAVTELPPEHHAAVMARVRLLDEQDQREQALRLLEAQPAGPEVYARRAALVRALRFSAELSPLLRDWAAKCPRDPRPLWQLATEAQGARDTQEALRLRKAAIDLHGAAGGDYGYLARSALDVGDFALAEAMLERTQPKASESHAKARLFWQHDIAVARGDVTAANAALRDIAARPDVQADDLRQVAMLWQMRGDNAAAVRSLQQALQLDPDQPHVREWLAELHEGARDDALFAPYRRDGAAVAKAFVAGERENGASTTIVVDQRIVAFAADGSSTSEVHELRRINDQAGVEAFGESAGLGHTDDLLLVRTIGADGTEWVPSRVNDDYSLQRLQPGAFVEWRFREHGAAPGADALSNGLFHFGGGHEPCALSEFVLITPPDGRGELRTRNLGAPVRDEALADGRRLRVYRLENIEALPQEPFLPSFAEILPCLQFGEDALPFAELRGQTVGLFWRTRVSQPIRDVAQELFAKCTDDHQKAKVAWEWCQQNVEDGQADNALDTLARKKGSRVLLTVALLRASGVTVRSFGCPEVRPEFRDGREELFADTSGVGAPGAAIVLGSGERIPLFSDVPRHWPLGAVPAFRGGVTGWLVGETGLEPIVLPVADGAMQSIRVDGRATVTGRDVVVKATVELGDLPGFGLAQRIRDLKQNVQKLAARQVAQQIFQGWRVDQAAILDEPGKPLHLEVEVKRAAVQTRGDGFVAQLPMAPSKLVTRYGDRSERSQPYRFTVDEETVWNIAFDPGEELRIARVPEPVAVHAEALQFTQVCAQGEHGLVFERRVRVSPRTIAVADFAAWLRGLGEADRAEQATIELVAR